MTMKNNKGISLIEILVVVSIFAILGIITARSVLLTIQGSKKTESTVRVRENLSYAMGVIERNIRNANKISTCPNPSPSLLTYVDTQGATTTFSCINIGSTNGYVASGSASLTSSTVNVTACSFVCALGDSGKPPSVTVTIQAKDKSTSGAESSDVKVTNKVLLRNY